MVLFTVTSTMMEAIEKLRILRQQTDTSLNELGKEAMFGDAANLIIEENSTQCGSSVGGMATEEKKLFSELPLLSRKEGSPISHGEIVDLWKAMRGMSCTMALDELMRGSRTYVPAPKQKPEPTSEYKALMSRLRHEEGERSYQRMTNPTHPSESYAQRFPMSSAAHAFSSAQQPLKAEVDDEVTYTDVNRQIALIFNILISIVACAAAIWMAAQWWSTPQRLALSFGGSLLVGLAEVVLYLGYVRKVGESKGKEKGIIEVKEIMRTWVVGGVDKSEGRDHESVPVTNATAETSLHARQRVRPDN
ncbi:endoplasmic reticulum-based factor for assembly of V-ATPase-domain-containing protein [Calycina marina]|uniref:Endoplasmic reticulum-based factor for assembly of V-ATPase-domain-containing protein n=1 Tax=Calycina marina TaxID=1763456 RepID=A0A9P7ZA11_9HELO|nr:endoplasmic reticulum-based factor for assembly of V-ATPase-domain-containing protein [Calycina marina]